MINLRPLEFDSIVKRTHPFGVIVFIVSGC